MSKLTEWWKDISTQKTPDQIGAMAQPTVDSSGRPVVHFEPEVVRNIRLAGGPSSYGEIYRRQPNVRICVNFLSRNIGQLGIKGTYKKPGKDDLPAPNHPLVKLLRKPNRRTHRFAFIRDTVSDIAVYDDGFWLKIFVGNNRALFRIPPVYVTLKGGNILEGPAVYQVDLQNGKGPVDYTPDQIVHFHGYNAHDNRFGSSPLEALRSMLEEDDASTIARRSYFRSGARIPGVIERPRPESGEEDWSDTARERFLADWRNNFGGSANAGFTPLLEDDMKFKETAFSPKDSEFIAGRDWGLDLCATAYQIPLAVLSRKGTSTFASQKEFRKQLYVDTLGPWNSGLEGDIWVQLVPDFGDETLFVEFNIEEKLQGDFEQQAEAFRNAGQVPFMAVNEMRRMRGLPPIDDEDFDVPARPANYRYESDVDLAEEAAIQEENVATVTQLDPAALDPEREPTNALDEGEIEELDAAMEAMR